MVNPTTDPPQKSMTFVGHLLLARVVDLDYSLDDGLRGVDHAGHLRQCQYVLGKARSAEPRTRMQKLAADAPVQADAPRNIMHVGADLLAQVRDLVDEGYLGRKKGIACIFGDFRRLDVREDHRRLNQFSGR